MSKVFLVEDSPLVLARLKDLLAGTAEVVGEASTAPAAIAGILATQPDMVFVDLNLAEGSGFDVLRAVGPSTAVYVLTNFANDGYRRKAESLGARGFFDKSTEVDKLRQALMQATA